jgi:hypothetical protein
MKKILIIIFLFLAYGELFSQSGMRFTEFEKKLEPYFDQELISDIKRQLPQGSDYSVWGWDVGDFSGDGFNDVALSLKLKSEKKKVVYVYMFVDIDGFLQQVGNENFEYFELPLETGVVIKQNACFITKKQKQNDWLIRSYTFDNGILMLLDDYVSQSESKINEESYVNYQTLKTSLKYLNNFGVEKFNANFQTLPSYSRGRQIYKGYANELKGNDIDFVTKGAFYWTGDEDASFTAKSAYDDDYLYFSLNITDDVIVTDACKDCATDYLELWFDTNPISSKGNRFMEKIDDKTIFRETTESGLFCLKIHTGDFIEKKPYVKELITAEDLDYAQKAQIKNIKVTSQIKDMGYTIKFKIPFKLFGFDKLPINDNNAFEMGCTILLHDIDNEYRPEEETVIATSKFDSANPSSFGSLLLIPNNKWYGETQNIYQEDIINSLSNYGF